MGVPGTSFAYVTVYDSVVAQNKDVGVYADNFGRVKIFHSVVSDNGYGIQALPGGLMELAQSMVRGIDYAYDQEPGGVIYTYGDNYIWLGANIGQLTPFAKQ